MSLFACFKCNSIENTATSNFWSRGEKPPLCSECDPEILRWHGKFDRQHFTKAGYQLCPDHRAGDKASDGKEPRIICPAPEGWDYCQHGKYRRA